MIYGVTGEPGAGKSMKMTSLMIEDLVSDRAFVVTNEAMSLPHLRRYVCELREKKGIEEPFDLDESFKWLPSEDVFEFWRHRSGGLVLAGSPDREEGDEESKRRRVPKEKFNEFMTSNFERVKERPEFQKPVHYYISETADYFDSQEWQTTGRAVKWYARKHRHLHDNIYLTAHNMDDVELRLRNLIGETIDMVNLTRRSIGPFKARPVIEARHYFKLKGGAKAPFMTTSSVIDVHGVGSCYNTAGALSVHQQPEAVHNRGKLPWWSLWVAGAGGVAAIVLIFVSLPWLAGRASAKMLVSASDSSVVKTATAGLSGESVATKVAPVASPDAVYLTSYVGRTGERSAVAFLSDGRQIEGPDLQHIGFNYVRTVDGRVYTFNPHPVPKPKPGRSGS